MCRSPSPETVHGKTGIAFLRELERAGLNTWQASWSERLETDWLRYKEQGGKLQLLLLSRPQFNDQPEMLKRAMKLQPLGIAQHGSRTNHKVLAAGRTTGSPQQVRERIAAALDGIKKTDAIILGIYQRYSDQIGQDAGFVREILGS